jgi:hypothetical protein
MREKLFQQRASFQFSWSPVSFATFVAWLFMFPFTFLGVQRLCGDLLVFSF